MRQRHIRPVIPTRKDQPRQRNFDRAAYRLRNKVERLINRLKQARRIATRYEKRGDNYLAMIHVGMILLWMKPFAPAILILTFVGWQWLFFHHPCQRLAASSGSALMVGLVAVS